LENSFVKIAVISDPQINLKNNGDTVEENSLEVLRECFKNMDVDAVVVCGDITENALPQEMDVFFDLFKHYCPKIKLFVIPGNMDGVYDPNTQNVYFEALERFYNEKIKSLYFAYETDSCFLIGISPEPIDGGTITDTQLTFLDDAIRRAAERGVPALVFSHYQLSDTIDINWTYASLGSDSPKIKQILEKYGSQIVFFSGHTHRGLISQIGGSVITKGNVTYVSTPSICKPDAEHYNADNDNQGTGYIVDVSKKCVAIKGIDFLHNEWLEPFDWIV